MKHEAKVYVPYVPEVYPITDEAKHVAAVVPASLVDTVLKKFNVFPDTEFHVSVQDTPDEEKLLDPAGLVLYSGTVAVFGLKINVKENV